MSDITIQPLEPSKSSSGRIEIKPAAPASPSATQGIRLGVNAANRTTSRIDLSAIPGAQAPIRAASAAPAAADEDIYKRRTSLLDTSKIPLAATPAPAPAAASSAAQPRTIRIARPTIRVGSSSSGSTFSPGRPAESAPAAEEPAEKPTIRLKRPSGPSIAVSPSSSSSSSSISPSDFVIQKAGEDEPGAVWAICALLSFLVAAGVIVAQILTFKGGAY